MTRNESLLQFQERLIDVALNSPRVESMNLLGIVYSNLKEFIEVRVVLDKNRDAILDKFFEVFSKFDSAIRYQFPNLYTSQDAYRAEWSDICTILSGSNDHELTNAERIALFAQYAEKLEEKDPPIGFMLPSNEFMHRDIFLKALHDFIKTARAEKFESEIPSWLMLFSSHHESHTNRYAMCGDEYDIAPEPSDDHRTIKSINDVLQWCSIKATSHHDAPDVKLSFILASWEHAYNDFSAAEYKRGFKVELDPRNPNYYRVKVINACLIGFDEIAKMVKDNIAVQTDDEIAPCKYQDSGDLSSLRFEKTFTERDLCRSRDIFMYRGPQRAGYLIHHLLEKFGMTRLLKAGFDDPETSWPIQKIADYAAEYREYLDKVIKKSVCAKVINGFGNTDVAKSNFPVWISYMTIYRTGKLPEETDPPDTNIADPNLRFILFLGFALRNYANFFIELRARGDERNNARIAELLMQHECMITTDPPNISGKKVHAKLWSFVPPYGDERIDVFSTGNFSTAAQTQFADTVMIQHMKEARMKINTDCFWSELRIPGQLTSNDYYAIDRRDYNWYPCSIRVRLLDLINSAKLMARTSSKNRPVIAFKCNHLTDPRICEKLIDAAKSGVHVILIVRSTCTMPQYINIRNLEIRSIAGKYLEHDRLYAFGYIDENKKLIETNAFMSSADLMERNLDNRVELMMRIPESMKTLEFLTIMATKKTDEKAGFFNFKL